ncbi:MAG: radical SAM protein [Spirochaetes bacterium]|nr:radical SAM protein [Spirochaetota bacterium]
MKRMKHEPCLAYADGEGRVWDFPDIEPAFRTGRRFVRVDPEELMPLPYGSYLFSLPGRYPVFYNRRNGDFNHIEVSYRGDEICAASAFLSSAYLRTYLPAYITKEDAPVLPLWAYAGLVVIDGEFFVPGVRVDEDPRSDPAIHENDDELRPAIAAEKKRLPENRLVRQLSRCATGYRCLCARNFFLGRYEAPVPTTIACNARCVGCLSQQEDGAPFPASQPRLDFSPAPEEIAQVILRHFSRVERAVASFGQGCEGEPLLRAADLAAAVRMVRESTEGGTININTNGSRPEGVAALIDAGIDSIRISLNSPTPEYYARYHRPVNYSFDDVLRSLDAALNAGIFVSINLFFLPGFTDSEAEVEALRGFLGRFPVNMIQTRNLNLDPDYYFDMIGFRDSESCGVLDLLRLLREIRPDMRLGYYNPPKETFRAVQEIS